MKKRPLRVLFLPVDDGGCGWYRIRTWHEQFQLMDNVESYLMDGKEQDPLKLIEKADVVVARLGDAAYVREIKTNIDPKKPVVFDHDDNTFEVLSTSEHYREFGTQDAYVQYEDGKVKPVWVSGDTEGFNRYKNLWGQMGLLFMLGAADMITSPVPQLTRYFMQYADDSAKGAVVPNSLNFDMFPEGDFVPKDKKKNEIRLGWQGGVSHMGDWQEVGDVIGKVLEDYPEVTIHIMGSYYKNQFESFKDRVTYYPWVPWKGYTYRLKTLGLDAAIIPLEDKEFNKYKSEIKYTEFSQLGVPCLVKDMLPYSAVVEGGKNAWTYKTKEDFEKYLREMLDDLKKGGKKSKKMVKKAQKWIKEERDVKKNAKKLVELYKSLLPEEQQSVLV
jgi:glycosyltransferase involved in cell wall biosynthesis